MICWNTNGLLGKNRKKLKYIQDSAIDEDAILILINETHLNSSIFDQEALRHLPDYNLYRTDRSRRQKGGSAIFVKKSMQVKSRRNFSSDMIEFTAIEIVDPKILAISFYRPPGTSDVNFREALKHIDIFLEETQAERKTIIFYGDLNFPEIKWNYDSEPNNVPEDLENFVHKWCMTQVVQFPTRLNPNNILDLIYTNDDQLIESISPNYTITDMTQRLSDHALISARINVNSVTKQSNRLIMKECAFSFESFDFYKCTEDIWIRLNEILERIIWEDKGNPTLNLEHFYQSTLHACIEAGVPVKITKRKMCYKNKHSRNRRAIFRKIKRLPKSKDKKIQELQSKLQQTYDDEKKDEEQRAVQCIKNNTKYFYKFVKSHCARKEDVSELKSSSGKYVSSDNDKANCLREQYSSVFSVPMEDKDILLKEKFTDTEISDFHLDEGGLKDAVKELKNNTSSGPDKFPAILLKRIIHSVCNPLQQILQQTIDMGEIPVILTSSIVCPIYKAGKDRKEPSSYRPVSLTSVIMRVFEKVIKKQMVDYFEKNNLINDSQHGFRKGRSCLTQLLTHYDEILRQIEEGHQVNVLYIDFEKCFGKVDFKILLNKAKLKGVTGKAYRWLENFLTKRTFKVKVGTELSEEEKVVSGIPQGTCLGPLLMLIMNSDIDAKIVNGKVGTLADDTKITNTITCNNDKYKMKEDLKSLEQWSSENNMKMNDDKFVLLCYNKKTDITNNLTLENGLVIKERDGTRDLGGMDGQ